VSDRLYRSPTDRVIAGVAGGLATWLRIDPSIVRVAWVVLAILSGGIFLLVYIVMMIVVPLPPPGWVPNPGPPPPGGAWTAGPGTAAPPPGGAWMPPDPGQGGPPPGGGYWTPPSGGAGQTWKAPDPGNAGIVFGVILVGLGAWFLIDQYIDIDWQLLWPVIVILIGAALIVAAVRRSRPPA
jgi:phage shock protein PspC (stress-responsive transcriptional regulator)